MIVESIGIGLPELNGGVGDWGLQVVEQLAVEEKGWDALDELTMVLVMGWC